MTSKRKPLIAANWKMHLLRQDAVRYCQRLRQLLENRREADVVLFPPFTLLGVVAEQLSGSAVAWGGQDLHEAAQGAHTGDISGPQLADLGATWALCGHSERRQNHGEGDALVGRKATAARAAGLLPLICVGESAAERQGGRTFEVLARQLAGALAGGPEPFALAYEPVWAIGTGETATPELAQKAHAFLRRELVERLGSAAGDRVRILYGGSVKAANAAGLIVQEDIDGFLVGGASLDADSFSGIISSSGSKP